MKFVFFLVFALLLPSCVFAGTYDQIISECGDIRDVTGDWWRLSWYEDLASANCIPSGRFNDYIVTYLRGDQYWALQRYSTCAWLENDIADDFVPPDVDDTDTFIEQWDSSKFQFYPVCHPGRFKTYVGKSTVVDIDTNRYFRYECDPCLPGYFCPPAIYIQQDQSYTSSPIVPCPTGTYNPGFLTPCLLNDSLVCGMGDNGTRCWDCPAGSYGPTKGLSECFTCPAGTFLNTTGAVSASACKACPAGTFGDALGVNCTTCPAGTFSPVGSTYCSSCPPGTFSEQEGLQGESECSKCPAGTYSSTLGLDSEDGCIDCPVGARSAVGSPSCSVCGAGEYSDGIDCHCCAEGQYGEGGVCYPCRSGTFANETCSSGCYLCSAGSYSLQGEDGCSACPPGTIASFPGSAFCTQCSAATVSNGIDCDRCGLGFEASGDQSECVECVFGTVSLNDLESCHFCDSGMIAISLSECDLCDAGTFAYNASYCESCQEGHYSLEGSTTCRQCPAGTFSQEGASMCTPCEIGEYEELPGQAFCSLQCPEGRFSSVQGATDVSQCQQCVPGTYANETASRFCSRCAPGEYQEQFGRMNCSKCPAGTFSMLAGAASSRDCIDCPVGTFSAEGSRVCTVCDDNTFADVSGSPECAPCDSGLFATGASASDHVSCSPCSIGSVLDDGECIECPAGQFASFLGDVTCHLCPPGFYAPNNASSFCLPCPSGTMYPLSGAFQCMPCDEDGWCPTGSTDQLTPLVLEEIGEVPVLELPERPLPVELLLIVAAAVTVLLLCCMICCFDVLIKVDIIFAMSHFVMTSRSLRKRKTRLGGLCSAIFIFTILMFLIVSYESFLANTVRLQGGLSSDMRGRGDFISNFTLDVTMFAVNVSSCQEYESSHQLYTQLTLTDPVEQTCVFSFTPPPLPIDTEIPFSLALPAPDTHAGAVQVASRLPWFKGQSSSVQTYFLAPANTTIHGDATEIHLALIPAIYERLSDEDQTSFFVQVLDIVGNEVAVEQFHEDSGCGAAVKLLLTPYALRYVEVRMRTLTDVFTEVVAAAGSILTILKIVMNAMEGAGSGVRTIRESRIMSEDVSIIGNQLQQMQNFKQELHYENEFSSEWYDETTGQYVQEDTQYYGTNE